MLQIVLLAGKFIFLIILYVFLYRVIRSSTRELRAAAPGPARPAYPVAAYAGAPGGAATLEPPSGPRPAPPVGATSPGVPVFAGRSSDMDIHLDDTFVSSKHALFEVHTSGLLLEDLLSTNGTQVNGSGISQPTMLSPGDRVEVGDTIFRVEVR
jgi:pSer/pThr/pTyr-binding forkhead associated (FHA) protein